MNLTEAEKKFSEKISQIATAEDPAHDFLHFKRVVRTARQLCEVEGGRLEVVLPAAWLHDFVIVPKNDPRRSKASQLSAKAALDFLREINYPEKYYSDIAHAIAAHSFSANIQTETIEAAVVQDADRLDGLGAIGLARCFATAGIMKRAFYSKEDPFCKERTADDSKFTLDHFYVKLFKTVESLKTKAGRAEGQRRVQIMQSFLNQLQSEI